jgi:deoxyhypusine monooxygenase
LVDLAYRVHRLEVKSFLIFKSKASSISTPSLHLDTMWGEAPSISKLQEALEDPSHAIGMRMRAAYYLKQAHTNSHDEEQQQDEIVEILSNGLIDKVHGSLMRHEFAYVMGQLKDERCCQTLEQVLLQNDDCVMVRHECAEALGAIGAERSRPVLEQSIQENLQIKELSDTCRLALNVMDWRQSGGDPNEPPAACACMLNPYSSVDPAPPHPAHVDKSTQELGDILLDASLPLFERYRAMFSLRNRGGSDSVKELGRALVEDTSSPLLRHEVAYVLGQLQHEDSVEALEQSLRRTEEHAMVRHESAEALGAIETRWSDVERILQEFTKDANLTVAESCLVALDAADYWGHATSQNDDAEEEEGEEPLSFVQQKNANQQILAQHFNVQC